MRRSFRSLIKTLIESMSGNQVWLEPTSDLNMLRTLISDLSPVPIMRPLIRIGGDRDGGYLVPDDLDGIDAALSPGVSTEIGFDLAMAERGVRVYMADASVEGPPTENPLFHFEKKFIDVFEDEQNTRLDNFCKLIPAQFSGDKILQMDVEGAEYRILLDTSVENLKRFRLMIIEFHDLHQMFGDFSFKYIESVFRKLLQTHHIVHIHPNNIRPPVSRRGLSIPPIMEFTFYRKDRVEIDSTRRPEFPHPLDVDNVSYRPSVQLPECWRG